MSAAITASGLSLVLIAALAACTGHARTTQRIYVVPELEMVVTDVAS